MTRKGFNLSYPLLWNCMYFIHVNEYNVWKAYFGLYFNKAYLSITEKSQFNTNYSIVILGIIIAAKDS
jgi:hypothetical protein